MRFKDSVQASLKTLQDSLDRIELIVRQSAGDQKAFITTQQEQNMAVQQEFTDLVAEVAAVKTVEDGAALGINRLLDIITGQVQAANDLAELKAGLTDTINQMRSNAQPLADAVATIPPEAPQP